MIPRLVKCSKTKSFFLFGGRATGKSSYLQKQWSKFFNKNEIFWIDLLEPEKEREFNLRPFRLTERILALKKKPKFIIISRQRAKRQKFNSKRGYIYQQGRIYKKYRGGQPCGASLA